MRTIDSTWGEDDVIEVPNQTPDRFTVKQSVDFYLNGIKKKLTFYSPDRYRSFGLGIEQSYWCCDKIGEVFPNCEIVLPTNGIYKQITIRLVNGLRHHEKSWAVETQYDENASKKEWRYKDKLHSYRDCPSVVYANFTLTWHEFDFDFPYREGEKPCVIYPPNVFDSNVLMNIDFNNKKQEYKPLSLKIEPQDIIKYEPKYFEYFDYDYFNNYVKELKQLIPLEPTK